jgi:hypothetical protein
VEPRFSTGPVGGRTAQNTKKRRERGLLRFEGHLGINAVECAVHVHAIFAERH